MPMDRSRYPANWEDISLRVRQRAGWCCEKCEAPNNVMIRRHKRRPERWITDDEWRALPQQEKYAWKKVVKCVLTVHHIGVRKPDGSSGDPSDKQDCRDENLIALCQRCHLLEDLNHHIQNRYRNYTTRQRAAGQLELWI